MPRPRPLRADEPARLGEYRLLGSLGEGGQGVVYLGESPSGARVAVKVLHARVAGDPTTRRRFLREVEAARQVPPFCTARVLDVGTAGERPYVVSEFIAGESLEQRVGSHGPLSPGDLRRLAVGTATALAAIHRAGIVHRDFKPANVLLGPDGPRVVDFGIAHGTDMATAATGMVGTPPYMSPEQFSGERVGPPSDMFSWAGTILFAGTGRSPFGSDVALAALMYRILNQECDLTGLPDDLRALAGRCLAKEPGHRPTAEEVLLRLITGGGTAPVGTPAPTGGDLLATAMNRIGQRLPANPPLANPSFAHPPTPPPPVSPGWERPAAAAPVGDHFAAPVGGHSAAPVGPPSWTPPPAHQPTRPAPPPGRGLSRRGFLIGGGAALATGAVAGAAVLVPRYLGEKTASSRPASRPTPGPTGTPPSSAPGSATPSSASPPAATPPPSALIPDGPLVLGNGNLVQGLAVSADGRLVAAGCWDGKVRLWEVPGGEMIAELDDRELYVQGLALSPDGRTLISLGGVGDAEAHVWDVASRRRVPKSVIGSFFVEFSPDGKRFVTGSGYEWVRLWRTSDREQTGAAMRHDGLVAGGAFSPDGSLLATAGWDRTVRLWRTSGHRPAGKPLTGHKEEVNAVVFLDGETLASAGYDKVVRVWDVTSGEPKGTPFRGSGSTVTGLALSPDGTVLAAATDKDGVRLWEVASRKALRSPLDAGQIQAVAFSGNGLVLAAVAGDDVHLYDATGLRAT